MPHPIHARALSPTEARLYAILAGAAGIGVAADELQVQLWGEATPATDAYLALYLRSLGQALAAQPTAARIVRRRNDRGYALTEAPAAASARV
jgi:DNA-binding response OmpR family regulator